MVIVFNNKKTHSDNLRVTQELKKLVAEKHKNLIGFSMLKNIDISRKYN